jgi:hypothetical protein
VPSGNRHLRAMIRKARRLGIAGPRMDPQSLDAPTAVASCVFVPNAQPRPAACNLTIAQGGLTACIELAAVATTTTSRS